MCFKYGEILFWKAVNQKVLGVVVENSSRCNTAVKSTNVALEWEERTDFNRREYLFDIGMAITGRHSKKNTHFVERLWIKQKWSKEWKSMSEKSSWSSICLISMRNCRVSRSLNILGMDGGEGVTEDFSSKMAKI